MNKTIHLAALGIAAAAFAAGCAGKSEVKPEPVQAQAAPTPTPVAKASYIVKKGDSLWKIAGKSSVLGDSFDWPLLFKANRDQIEDPDLIDVKEDLSYDKEYSKDEIEEAVSKAKETPPFVPHAAPRKSLPVKY
jgi:nucleoid-associated protein YgaU